MAEGHTCRLRCFSEFPPVVPLLDWRMPGFNQVLYDVPFSQSRRDSAHLLTRHRLSTTHHFVLPKILRRIEAVCLVKFCEASTASSAALSCACRPLTISSEPDCDLHVGLSLFVLGVRCPSARAQQLHQRDESLQTAQSSVPPGSPNPALVFVQNRAPAPGGAEEQLTCGCMGLGLVPGDGERARDAGADARGGAARP